jgi:hypothetical protein
MDRDSRITRLEAGARRVPDRNYYGIQFGGETLTHELIEPRCLHDIGP